MSALNASFPWRPPRRNKRPPDKTSPPNGTLLLALSVVMKNRLHDYIRLLS
jgi:hypothetical protein